MKTGIIIQARKGSTRLPGKMLMPFSGDKNLLDLIIEKIKKSHRNVPVILATTQEPGDDEIEETGKKHGIEVFRGDTQDVLNRFIKAAEKYGLDNIIRVCADNPFLDTRHIKTLIKDIETGDYDYVSYQNEHGTPVIKTHLGLFTEAVKLESLKKVKEQTKKPHYREHVTNYIYENPKKFNINLKSLPSYFNDTDSIRLTLDTAEDFELEKEIFSQIKRYNMFKLIKKIKENKNWMERMKKEIEKNKK